MHNSATEKFWKLKLSFAVLKPKPAKPDRGMTLRRIRLGQNLKTAKLNFGGRSRFWKMAKPETSAGSVLGFSGRKTENRGAPERLGFQFWKISKNILAMELIVTRIGLMFISKRIQIRIMSTLCEYVPLGIPIII